MKSQEIFPLSERPKNGIYKKKFDCDKNFKELYDIMKKYHFALIESEKMIKENNLSSESFILYPLSQREPLDKSDYVGSGKFAFYGFKISVEKYHKALMYNEYIINEHINNKQNNVNI